jgi:pilus assembly protein Flp/PilA
MLDSYRFLTMWLQARFAGDERGATLVEYALLVALISVICIAALSVLGGNASAKFDEAGTSGLG